MLKIKPASKAAIKQRTGRAGRTRPGKCFRLFSEDTAQRVALDYALPSMLTDELSETVLQIFAETEDGTIHPRKRLWDVPFISRPPVENM